MERAFLPPVLLVVPVVQKAGTFQSKAVVLPQSLQIREGVAIEVHGSKLHPIRGLFNALGRAIPAIHHVIGFPQTP